MTRWWLWIVVASGSARAAPTPPAMEPDDLKGPVLELAGQAEVADPPRFEVPAPVGGVHDVRELRVHPELIGRDVKVGGYITWIYDCITANMKPGVTRAGVARLVDDDPTMCERAKLYLGPTRDAPPDDAIWVVDVPRPPNRLEKERLPAEELAKWPPVPKLAVGDYVVITGAWALQSPHSERNSDGLLVFQRIDHVAPPPSPPKLVAVPSAPVIAVTATTKAPLRPVVSAAARNASAAAGDRCALAYGKRDLPKARTECAAAVAAWDHNHTAWYVLAGSHALALDHAAARDAAEHAVALRPDNAMYQLFLGRMTYEAILDEARKLAHKPNAPTQDVDIDRSKLDFTPALRPLLIAIKLEPKLWRAHYALGRIYRDGGFVKDAAAEFTSAVRSAPPEPSPYMALSELYRAWRFRDQALAVATIGTTAVPEDKAADVWFEVGMANDALGHDADAVAAFSKVLALDPDHVKAKFQRGQCYFRLHDKAKARRDLTDYLAAVPGGLAAASATQMLAALK